ncbi:acyl-CoA dehydrogenase family protein [Allorhizocola rhizosphaerae]|uniref:acyl-CoA dehydrogenase family protein n=1 Tax=Allorhizocola rhizosphaerae TaxID=1872709 RepID=UPI000E3D5D31|nr:acyl-CoA dehydrogenase [Allorhizocola rhizosphaerae]
MDFSLTEEQQELAGLARQILSGNRPLWKEFDAAGLLDPSFTLLQQCSVLIEVGRAGVPIPYLWHVTARSHENGVHSIALGRWVPNPDADIIVGPGGIVSPDGMQRHRIVDGSEEGVLAHDVGDDAGMRAHATVGLCALQLGVLERALEMTAAYACERVQFGRPIGTFQAVTQRLADAYIDVEAVRLSMWQAAWLLSQDLPCAGEIATAKFWACDAGHRVAHTAVHVHGGVGIDLDHPMHRYFVVAKRNEFTLGHATDHLLALGRTL